MLRYIVSVPGMQSLCTVAAVIRCMARYYMLVTMPVGSAVTGRRDFVTVLISLLLNLLVLFGQAAEAKRLAASLPRAFATQ